MRASRLVSALGARTNNLLLGNSCLSSCLRLRFGGQRVGIVKPDIAAVLLGDYADVFAADGADGLVLRSESAGFDGVSEQLARVFADLRRRDAFACLRGWRDEQFCVRSRRTGRQLFAVERSAASLLGVGQRGCHVNGYTVDNNSSSSNNGRPAAMWIARRSTDRPTWPGCYDNVAGGGLPHGVRPGDNARKEAAEEAGVPDSLLAGLRPAGTVSYFYEDSRGVFPDVEFCYDLRLPADFRPVSVDGEVSEFHLVRIADLPDWLADDSFKPNSGLVCLDFLLRHGFVQPDSEPMYELLVEICHAWLPLD